MKLKQEAGMTLVEVMVVVAIIAVMATFAFASIDMKVLAHRAAAREFYSALQFAKITAIKNNTSASVGVNLHGWGVQDASGPIKSEAADIDRRVTFGWDDPTTAGNVNGTSYSAITTFNNRSICESGAMTYHVIITDSSGLKSWDIPVRVSVAGGVKMFPRVEL